MVRKGSLIMGELCVRNAMFFVGRMKECDPKITARYIPDLMYLCHLYMTCVIIIRLTVND
jgi:hypothetical protein